MQRKTKGESQIGRSERRASSLPRGLGLHIEGSKRPPRTIWRGEKKGKPAYANRRVSAVRPPPARKSEGAASEEREAFGLPIMSRNRRRIDDGASPKEISNSWTDFYEKKRLLGMGEKGEGTDTSLREKIWELRHWNVPSIGESSNSGGVGGEEGAGLAGWSY